MLKLCFLLVPLLLAMSVAGCSRSEMPTEPPTSDSRHRETGARAQSLAIALRDASVQGLVGAWRQAEDRRQNAEAEAPMKTLSEEVAVVLGYDLSDEYIHVRPIATPPGVSIVTAHVTTHAGLLVGVLVGDDFGTPEQQCARALLHWGWAEADAQARETLAMNWVSDVLLSSKGGIQHRDHPAFGKKRRPPFTPPQATTAADGAITVELWYREPEWGQDANVTLVRGQWEVSAQGECGGSKTLSSFQMGRRDFFQAGR